MSHSLNFLLCILMKIFHGSFHIDNFCRYISRALGLLKTAKYYFPRNTLKFLFFTYFVSRFDYGLYIWGNYCVSFLYRLKVLHNKCIRILVANADYYAHVPPLARQLNIIKFEKLYFICFV